MRAEDAARLGLALLREDPCAGRIPADRQPGYVQAALDDGRALARAARARWGAQAGAVAAGCAVAVCDHETEAGWGSTWVFADYRPAPPTVSLYLPRIRALDARLHDSGWAARLGLGPSRDIFLAHELYHHLDAARGAGQLGRRHRVTLWHLGPLRWDAGLASLAEIAAGAFAAELLGLGFHPRLLELLAAGREP